MNARAQNALSRTAALFRSLMPHLHTLQNAVQTNLCCDLQRIATACSASGGDALLLQTSAWVLADVQRLMVPCPHSSAPCIVLV